MNVRRTLSLHLESRVDLDIEAISQGPGHDHAAVVIGITVPAGVAVKLIEPVVILQDGTTQTPMNIRVEMMTGPAGYGIEFDLPHQNPRELVVTVPPLSIDGRRVDVQPLRFILKTRPHVTGLCQ